MSDDINRRAYALWEQDGRPEGQDKAYWFRAIAELTSEAAKTIKPVRKRAVRTKKGGLRAAFASLIAWHCRAIFLFATPYQTCGQ
ncbi:DUF2934 domain-containing protein [Devosia sp. SD17-2]|uniref:DUF2934 domain-containing protein n=1 Tax=Devosia sp. SD17-2 TaxID=2976459 RepID=UPI0023D7F0CD|nr:DUF2934 domain-containing protein [Devosia sp. SD17-2]WEJ31420.1 DUF2934 domain-containing protein [Devosia sp. SD17-2]